MLAAGLGPRIRLSKLTVSVPSLGTILQDSNCMFNEALIPSRKRVCRFPPAPKPLRLLAAGLGIEPKFSLSESDVLPLDDPAK